MASGTRSFVDFAAVTVFCFILAKAAAQNPCANVPNHIGSVSRSPLNTQNVNLCDRTNDINLWHSFEAATGGEIPELGAINTVHCGTSFPIFIKKRAGQSFHDEAKANLLGTATAPVCANYGGPNSPCDWRSTITIQYCPASDGKPEFYLYKLAQPAACPIAYCAGTTTEDCPPGLIWDQGREECVSLYPPMTNPRLEGPLIVQTDTPNSCDGTVRQRFAFFCNIGYEKKTESERALFIVQVLFDNVVDASISLPIADADSLRVEIDGELFRGNFGKTVRCEVTSYWEGSPITDRSPPLLSNDYWAGIRSVAKVVDLDKPDGNHPYTVDLYSTVPITCWQCNAAVSGACMCCQDACNYRYEHSSTVNSVCGADVTNAEYSPGEEFVGGRVKFGLREDAKLNPNKNYAVQFMPYINPICDAFNIRSIWDGYKIPNAAIQVKSVRTTPLSCTSKADPHIDDIYKRRGTTLLLGDFMLARVYDEANEMYMEIHTRQFDCADSANCNCGVIVREGNSIVGVDGCENHRYGTGVDFSSITTIRYLASHRKGDKPEPDGSAIYRDTNGRQFFIVMGSGMRVDVTYTEYNKVFFLNVVVTFPPKYTSERIGGMCGFTGSNFNGEQFRLLNEESMFVANPPQCVPWLTEPAVECVCENDMEKCSNVYQGYQKVNLEWTGYACYPREDSQKRNASERMAWSDPLFTESKSDDMIDLKFAFYAMEYDEDHGKDVVLVWPTPLGKTEAEVRTRCLSALQSSPVYAKCQGKFDEEEFVGSCVSDVQITDDYAWADSYPEAMEAICINALIVESNATSIEELEDDPMYNDVVDNVCPGHCNNRGACEQGACICNEGFAGPDCGVSIYSPPDLAAIEHGGTCNISERFCATAKVLARNIFESEDLTCRFSAYPLLPDSDSDDGLMTTQGMLKSFSEVECPLPTSRVGASSGYGLSLSNDGELFSNELQLIVHDPACLELTGGTWRQKLRTCFFNERCYIDGQRKDNATCDVCTPGEEMNKWTDGSVWGEWSACSRECDLGVREREFGCSGVTTGRETTTCNQQNCPAKPNEFFEGVVLHTDLDDVKQVLDKSDEFFELIAAAVNSYCSQHPDECCFGVASAKAGLTKKADITSVSQTYFASGYPVGIFDVFRTKVIVTATRSDLDSLCGTLPGQPQDEEVFVDIFALYYAVLADKEHIESVLEITISHIEPPVRP